MNVLERALLEVIGWRPNDEVRAEAQRLQEESRRPFGPRSVDSSGNTNSQWKYGANRMVDVACKTSDDLAWWYDKDIEQYIVRNSDYDMERAEDELWRAMWLLERDIRVEHGTKWSSVDERGEFPSTPEPREAEE